MTLPPYDPEVACPKCGHNEVNTVYSNGFYRGNNACTYDCPAVGRGREHMERLCLRCSYRWAEAALPPAPWTAAASGEGD